MENLLKAPVPHADSFYWLLWASMQSSQPRAQWAFAQSLWMTGKIGLNNTINGYKQCHFRRGLDWTRASFCSHFCSRPKINEMTLDRSQVLLDWLIWNLTLLMSSSQFPIYINVACNFWRLLNRHLISHLLQRDIEFSGVNYFIGWFPSLYHYILQFETNLNCRRWTVTAEGIKWQRKM